MEKRILALRNHIVVCGAGQTGQHVIEELFHTDQNFVVIEKDEERLRWVLQHVGAFPYLVGDASEDEVLQAANIAMAHGMISTLGTDKDNLFATITARSMNARMFIASRVDDPATEAKLLRAGANRVVNSNIIGGLRLASEVIRPETVTFLDDLVRR